MFISELCSLLMPDALHFRRKTSKWDIFIVGVFRSKKAWRELMSWMGCVPFISPSRFTPHTPGPHELFGAQTDDVSWARCVLCQFWTATAGAPTTRRISRGKSDCLLFWEAYFRTIKQCYYQISGFKVELNMTRWVIPTSYDRLRSLGEGAYGVVW